MLTLLEAGKRQAKYGSALAGAIESWERGREVLMGEWECSGSEASTASEFPKWILRDQKGKEHGYVRCAFQKLSGATEAQKQKWQEIKELAQPKQVIVRVYVIEGINLPCASREPTT
eukprot:COSAG05_NODE_3211_length_2240_cov_2.765530_3_plen_117_part_00